MPNKNRPKDIPKLTTKEDKDEKDRQRQYKQLFDEGEFLRQQTADFLEILKSKNPPKSKDSFWR